MAQLSTKIKQYAASNGVADVDFMKDVLLQDDGQGPYIKAWNLAIAKPTDAQLADVEAAANTAEANAQVVSARKAAYGSMEAQYPPPTPDQGFSTVQAVLLVISKFIESESEYFLVDDEFEKEFEDSLTDPDEDESTELGEVPHADQKGSIRPGYIYSPYGISSIYRYE